MPKYIEIIDRNSILLTLSDKRMDLLTEYAKANNTDIENLIGQYFWEKFENIKEEKRLSELIFNEEEN